MVQRGLLEVRGEVVHVWGARVVGFSQTSRSVGLGGLRVRDLGGRERATGCDGRGADAALLDGEFGAGDAGGGVGGGDVEDVEGAAGGGLGGGGLGGVVGDVVAVHYVLRLG